MKKLMLAAAVSMAFAAFADEQPAAAATQNEDSGAALTVWGFGNYGM